MLRTRFDSELEAARQNLIQMGDVAVTLLGEALRTVAEPGSGPSARASELESQTDHLHRLIHDQCLNLITLQAPVARDARMVTAILDAIVDLELIGDYAYEIATLSHAIGAKPPSQIFVQVADVGGKVRDSLSAAIDTWRSWDRARALSAREREPAVRAGCASLYEKLAQLVSGPGAGAPYMDLMLVCKHLERILRHAICVADQAVDAAPGVPGA